MLEEDLCAVHRSTSPRCGRVRRSIAAGETFHIDSGALHQVENIGDTDAEFILAFRHERPEDFGLSAAVGAMSDAVLGNTYDLPAAAFVDP